MRERNRVFLLIIIMIFISLIVVGIASYMLYSTAFDDEKTRLVETAQSQARLIEAVARFDSVYGRDYPEGAERATLSQIADAHANYKGFGHTGEFTLARRAEGEIVFLLKHRHYDLDYPKPVPFESELAEPMRLALSGMSGTVIGLDYRGEKVLAAYEPVGELNLGIVAKIDLAEIRAPFVRAGLIALGSTILAALFGAVLFFRITNPMIKHLAESEERFRSLVETSPDGITLTDLDGKILICNPQTVKLHGFKSQEEIIGKSSLEFIAPEDQQKAIDNIERTLKDGTVKNAEYALLKKDGTNFPGEVNTSLMVDKEGKPVAFMAVTRDISEQKQAEEKLHEKEQWLTTTLRSIGDAVIATDAKGIVNFMNHVAEGLTGWDEAKAAGKPLKDVFNIINEETGKPAENPVARVIREGTVVGLANHTALIAKDGTKRLIADSGAPMKDEEGNVMGVVMVFRDITERKKAEKELENIFNLSPDMVAVFTTEGKLLKVNPSWEKVLGYTQKELLDKGWAKLVHPDDVERTNKEVGKQLKGSAVVDFVNRYKCKDGSYKTLEWQATFAKEGIVHATARDITDRKKAEEEKEKLHLQLIQAEKMAGIGILTSGIAHEFNNLLQIMSGHAEYAHRTKKPKDMEEALEIVVSASDRVSKIIGDLLAFSRKDIEDRELCKITKPIENALSLVEKQLEKDNVKLIKKFISEPMVEVNRNEIQQVVLNIITNARDSMMPDGGRLEIGIKKVQGHVEISFLDTGEGIDPTNLSRIFDPFYTTKGAIGGDRKIQGIGLGLSVSYGIIKRHDGTIAVDSEIGKGTTFTIRLPLKKKKVKKKRAGTEEMRAERKLKFLNILAVDDEPNICRMLEKWLSADGHKVKSVQTGRKAINLVKKEYYNLVFLDIVMPGIPGDEALVKIKEISPKTKVVMITGSLLKKESWEKLKQKGASGFIQKPFKMEDIKKFL